MANNLISNGSKKIDEAIHLLNEAAEKNLEKLQSIPKMTKEAIEEGTEKIKKTVVTVNKAVHKNPWKVLGGVAAGAFALGCLLGLLKKK